MPGLRRIAVLASVIAVDGATPASATPPPPLSPQWHECIALHYDITQLNRRIRDVQRAVDTTPSPRREKILRERLRTLKRQLRTKQAEQNRECT